MDKHTWGQPAPAAVAVKPPTEPRPAEEVAAETHRLLEDPGWCLWRCSTLDNEVIVVVRDELVTGYPAGFPVYTSQELVELAKAGGEFIRVAHEAKKTLGAKVAAVEGAAK